MLAAVYLLPLAGGYLLSAPLPSRLQGRHPTSLLLLVGTAILVAGTLLFGFMSAPQINFFTYLVPGLLLGMGMGLAQSFKTTAVLSEAPPELAGAASATNNVSNNLGASLAVALSSALMGSFVLGNYHALLVKAGLPVGPDRHGAGRRQPGADQDGSRPGERVQRPAPDRAQPGRQGDGSLRPRLV